MGIITKHLLISYCLFISVESQFNRPPTVNSVNTFFTAFENATIGSLIYQFIATDPDNDVLTFSAGSSDTDSLVNVTQLSSSGNIYTCGLVLKTQLDRDNSPSVRQLHVKIKDLSFEITYKILMIINDVNDNPPTFTGLPYRFSLLEDTALLTPVFTVSATDPDTGSGGQIFYSMNASSSQDDADYKETFSLTSNTGIIHLKRKLDYETKSFYHFKVYSRDNGNPMCPSVACICTASPDVCRGDPVDLFITIIDVEDTPPVFDGLPYIKTIYENQLLGTSVIQLKATDGDRGVSVPNKVQYTITDGNTDTNFPFSIDLMNGTIVVSKILDADNPIVRSRGGLYLFTVTATEVNGTGQFDPSVSVSSTQVSITVSDVNDNLPEFKQGTYSGTVQENTPKGAPLLMSSTIEVEDIDQTGNNMFSVVIKKDGAAYTDFTTLPDENQKINGRSSITIIVVNSSVLDYEVRKNITFQLVAEALNGTGFITNLTSVTVSLQITDVNDNSPYFPSQATHFNVPENASVGTFVTQVNASDLDSGDYGTITFSLEDSETAFSINNQTGKLSVNSLLDRETRAVYNLAILATDSPLHPEAERRRSRLQININVTDVNDNAPEWTQSVPYVSVLESTTVGTNITQLLATDRDEGLNGQIVFSIAPNTNGSTLFNVSGDNGKAFISVKKSLVNNVGLRTVIVVATDRGSPPLSSNVTISILVVDENQNKPVFVVPDQSAFNESTGKIPEIVIDEEIPPGSFLIQLSATDADQGLNGLVFYYLDFTLGEDSEYFRVDRVSGNMTSVKRLDREKQEIYEIRVKAEDNGQPASLSTSLPIRVRLRDVDDNYPTYDKVTMPQTMFVTEEMSPASMGNITPATDIDFYPNNITCYYLYEMCNASRTSTHQTTTSTTRGTTTTTTTATTRGTTHASQHFITDLPATATGQSGNVRHDFICHFATVEIFLPVSEAPNAVLRLRDPSCVLVNNGTHHVITFPFNTCGTSVTSFKDYSIVTNYVTVHTDLHVSAPVVFGDDYNISLECQVPEHMVLDGSFQAVTKEPAHQVNANPQMGFHLREYTSADYTQEITKYPVQVSINKEIFLEVTLADETSRNTTLGVKVNECRATPSPDPHDSTSYLLIRDSCPATPAVHLQSSPSPETYRFSVQTFHFSGNTNTDDVVYIHCDVSICHDDKCGFRCGASGGARRKRRSGLSKRNALGSTLTSGPHIVVN